MVPNLKLIVVHILLVGGLETVASFSPPPTIATRSSHNSGIIKSINEEFGSSCKPPSNSFTTTTTTTTTTSTTLPNKSTIRNTPSSTTTALSAVAIPDWTIYAISHNIGGITNAPIVTKAQKWYKRIPLPTWTPPNFAFAPTWTLLYGLMGYSLSRIVKSGSPLTNLATRVWLFHYAANIAWAPIFFGFQNLRLGLLVNFFLVGSLGLGVLPLYYRIDPLAAYLQVPYLVWLLFATKLNQAVCKLNPMVGGVNEAMVQADLCASGEGYNDAMLQYDIKKLQAAAAKYAGL